MVFGTEFGNQKSQNERITGFFANGTVASAPISAFAPTTFQPVFFNGLASDARNQTNLNLAAVYVQDQVELTRWLQFIGGVRFDRFDLSTSISTHKARRRSGRPSPGSTILCRRAPAWW